MAKGFNLMSTKDYHALRVVFIIILLWIGVWNLVEEVIQKIQEKTGFERWHIYLALVILMIMVVIYDPYTFEKL